MDDIGLASTDASDQDSEQEFEVEDILACEERDGEIKYLVSWANYEMHSCTWEPVSNLSKKLMDQYWVVKQAEIDRGERPVFDTGVFEKAKEDWAAGYPERHQRRNRERKARGLPTTRRSCDDDDDAVSTDDSEVGSREKHSDETSSSDEAMEEDQIESSPKERIRSSVKSTVQSSQPKPKQTTFKGAARPTSSHSSNSTENHRRASQVVARSKSPVTGAKLDGNSSSVRVQVPANATGYQGTARGPSTTAGTRVPATSQANASRTGGPSLAVRVASTTGVGSLGGMMARKTVVPSKGHGKAVSANVFQGGKTRKAPNPLEDAAIDPSKDAKHFRRQRIARLSEKRSRDREDKAPEASILRGTLFDISKGQQVNGKTLSTASGAGKYDALMTAKAASVEIISDDDTSTAPSAMRPALKKQSTGLMGGRKKSVQFAAEEDELLFSSEPMVLDNLSDVEDPAITAPTVTGMHDEQFRPPTPPRRLKPPAAPSKKLSFAEYRIQRSQASTSISFAFSDISKSVDVSFQGVAGSDAGAGLTAFLEKTPLNFGHSCLAQIFLSQLEQLERAGSSVVRAGILRVADAEAATLEAVAGHLRANLTGLCYVGTSYLITLYPSKCDDWKVPNLGADSSDPSDASLRFIVVSNNIDLSSHLVSLNDFKLNGINELDLKLKDRVLMLRRSLDWQYGRLVSAYRSESNAEHHFMLVFPECKAQTTLPFVVRWIQACDSQARVYFGHHPGAWTSFISREKTKADVGIVMVHESLASALRRFPGLPSLIQNEFCNIWSFSESLEANPALPSLTMETNVSSPGVMSFQRLFPHRASLLLTPSFLVSEPRQAYTFLKWFHSNRSPASDWKLVTAHNIADYMRGLALSAADERSALLQNLGSQSSVAEKLAVERKLSREDCEARFKAWGVVAELEELREQRAGRLAYNEENSPVIFADEAIDANDEQSLVNWFGLWSLMRLDQFRKFHVIGTEDRGSTGKGGFVGQTRRRVPRIIERLANESKATVPSKRTSESTTPPSIGSASADPMTLSHLHSKHFGEFAPDKLQDSLQHIVHRGSRASRKWVLYSRPLSAAPCPVLPRPFGVRFDYFSMEEWWSFWRLGQNPAFNTYLGFFCTSKDASEFENVQDRQPVSENKRSPWVVACRKVPHRQFDLVIWDPDAPRRCPAGKQPTDRDLLPAQSRLVEFLSQSIRDREPQDRIEKVWLGGFESVGEKGAKSMMDSALDFIDAITESLVGLMTYLPLSDWQLRDREYRQVKAHLETKSNSQGGTSDRRDVHNTEEEDWMDIDSADEDLEATFVFQPPTGSGGHEGGPSHLRNHLFDQVSAALHEAEQQRDTSGLMTVKFRPTLEWFEEQRAEGRTLNHINVAAWPSIFRTCKIPQRPGEKDGKNSDRSEGGPTRKDSQISA